MIHYKINLEFSNIWLKVSDNSQLEFTSILGYQKIIKAVVETDRVMLEIDG